MQSVKPVRIHGIVQVRKVTKILILNHFEAKYLKMPHCPPPPPPPPPPPHAPMVVAVRFVLKQYEEVYTQSNKQIVWEIIGRKVLLFQSVWTDLASLIYSR